jgi:ribonuclease HI
MKGKYDPPPRVYDATPDAIIYSDGSSNSKTRQGGWGAHIQLAGRSQPVELWGSEADTTNNRMEIMGALQGLLYLKPRNFILVHTDSQYVIDGITSWVHGWQRRGWVTVQGDPVKNADLWLDLIDAVKQHQRIEWEWVRGHNGNVGNERADALARRGYRGELMPA